MSKTVVVGGNEISFPTSGEQENWAQPVSDFAEATAEVLSQFANAYDVPPNDLIIDAYNPGVDIELPGLNFPPSAVRSAFIRYAVFRQTNTTTVYETGNITIVYNPNGPVNNKWEYSRDFIGDGQIDFTIDDSGQITFTTTAIGGISHSGKVSYLAQAVIQT